MCRKIIFTFVISFFSLLTGLCNAAESTDADCPFRTPTKCYTCDTSEAVTVGSEEECISKCPNREVNSIGSGTGMNYNYNCVLKKCPADKPLRGYYGNCKSCDDPSDDFETQPDCSVCANRYEDKDGKCQFKNNRPLQREKEEETFPEQPCPADKPLQQWNNECFSCDTPKTIYIDGMGYFENPEKFNAVCPNRVIINTVGGERPSVPACPKEYPLLDYNGLCHSCAEEGYIDLRWNENFCHRFCGGQRYITEKRGGCQVCPPDKSKLNPRECAECGGRFIRGKCRS